MLVSLAGIAASAQRPGVNEFGSRTKGALVTSVSELQSKKVAKAGPTVEDLLGAPEGTVYAGAFVDDGGYMGFQNSDQGRTDNTTKFFQHFSSCYHTFSGIRFFGLFNYWDAEKYSWMYCDERGGINEQEGMTKPVRFEISLYKEGADGMPGERVYFKEVDLLGKNTGVDYGDAEAGYQNIQVFDVNLGQDIKMETGYISVSAVDMGDSPSCWFSLFTASSSVDFGVIQWDGEEFQYSTLPMIFYLTGSGDMAAGKALKFNRLMSPAQTADGRYERVQIELVNAGSETLSDACLELWADGRKVSTEPVDAVMGSLETYKHTFTGRIDCSEAGVHKFEIRNVTPGDEKLCAPVYAFSIEKRAVGAAGESYSESCEHNYISNVSLGDMNNASEASNYSDFTDRKAVIRPGETLSLSVTPSSRYAYTTAWIDWNGNGVLGEKGETYELDAMGFVAEVRVPDGVVVEEGDKLVRIITSYDTPLPEGMYSYGETEDYTLTVMRHENSPAVGLSAEVVEEVLDDVSGSSVLTVSNGGGAPLTGNLKYTYILPGYPGRQFSTADPVAEAPFSIARKALPAASRAASPKADAATSYTLRYDNGQYDAIGIENSEYSIYANLYPGSMLKAVSGMTMTSVDVYVSSVPENCSIVIYGENTQNYCGELLLEQPFTATPDSWNHVVLDSPVAVEGKDLWVGVKMSGFANAQYHIGIDHGTALRGFADIVNIGGETWWSMADLGLDYNYCIRANVSGQPVPAISWLTVNNDNVDIAANGTADYKLDFNASGLEENALYEALVEITTNDALRPVVSVPVYLVNGTLSSIAQTEADAAEKLVCDGSCLRLVSDKHVASLAVYTVSGQLIRLASGSSVSVADMNGGIYIVAVTYADGSSRTFKAALRK